jgi:hypothetical protein
MMEFVHWVGSTSTLKIGKAIGAEGYEEGAIAILESLRFGKEHTAMVVLARAATVGRIV